MMMERSHKRRNNRVLVIDDNPSIHIDFRRILAPELDTSELDVIEASLFGTKAGESAYVFEVTSAYRGEDALELVHNSLKEQLPYALAFVDVRMPNGWDGVETLTHIWQEDPAIQVVLCTAYSDYSLSDIAARFKQIDNLLVLTKPFEPIEVQQMALALTEKWSQRVEIEARSSRASVQYEASKALLEAESLSKGVQSVLGIVGASLRCDLGVLWLTDKSGRHMHCECMWEESSKALGDFETIIRETTRSFDASSMRRDLDPGAARWNEDIVADRDDAWATAAARAGLHIAVQFPVQVGGDWAGVLEFFSSQRAVTDQADVAMMHEICAKLGTFLRSKQIESTLRESEAKNRALLRAIPDEIFLLGAEGQFVDLKASSADDPAAVRGFDGASGKRVTDVLSDAMVRQVMLHVERVLSGEATQTFDHEETTGGNRRSVEVRIVKSAEAEALIVIRDITERKRMEMEAAQLHARDELFRTQAEALAELSAPLIPLREDVVVMPLVGALDLRRVQRVQEVLVEGVSSRHVHTTILDFTGVPSLTIESAAALLRIAQAVRLLGSEMFLTGMRAEVARALVGMGIDLSGIVTYRTLQTGIAFALERIRR